MQNYKINEDYFKNSWKQVKNQSERQIGAFLFAYLILIGEAYSINTKMSEFRNKVIHKGYTPTDKEVAEYANYVLFEINKICMILKDKNLWQYVVDTFLRNIDNAIKEADLVDNCTNIAQTSVINLTIGDKLFGKKSFDQAIAEMSLRRITMAKFKVKNMPYI